MCVYYKTLREYYYNIITPPPNTTTTAAVAADYLRVDRKNPLNAKQKLIGYYKKKKKMRKIYKNVHTLHHIKGGTGYEYKLLWHYLLYYIYCTRTLYNIINTANI